MGLTVFDAGVVIGLLDPADPHQDSASAAFRAALDRGDQLALPASALAEVLVGPSRLGPDVVAQTQRQLDRLSLRVEPVDDDVAIEAARIRAHHPRVRLPDALVIATAVLVGADRLVTTDRRWPTRGRLRLQLAIDVL